MGYNAWYYIYKYTCFASDAPVCGKERREGRNRGIDRDSDSGVDSRTERETTQTIKFPL